MCQIKKMRPYGNQTLVWGLGRHDPAALVSGQIDAEPVELTAQIVLAAFTVRGHQRGPPCAGAAFFGGGHDALRLRGLPPFAPFARAAAALADEVACPARRAI